MTAKHLIKRLSKSGNTVLGVGCYSAVVEFVSSPLKVFKIGNDAADPFLEYCYMLEDVGASVHTPKIFNLMVDAEHDYYVCVMEKLTRLDTKAEPLVEACEHYCTNMIDKFEFFEEAEKHTKLVPNPDKLLVILNELKKVVASNDDIAFDLHFNNFMQRDGVLVITDPFKDDCMDDLEDLSAWAEDQINY